MTLVTRARAAGIIALFCVALLPASVLASGTLDQSYEDTTGTIAGSSYGSVTVGAAQTFTPAISGSLDTVALHGASLGSCVGGTHTVQIRSVTLAGLPVGGPTDTSGVLAEETNVACSVGFYNITFTSPATVVAGQQYAIVWGSQSVYHLYKPGGTYAGGRACGWNGTSWNCGPDILDADWLFRTYVTRPSVQPDAQIRLGSGSYVGDNIYNTDALGQKVSNTGAVEQKLTFFIKIQNDNIDSSDSFKVKRSSGFTDGYKVRYYNAAGTDVTGKVTNGSFTTPSLVPGSDYVMRATVKVRSLATLCSLTSRLITVSSVNDPSARDAVRFTAALAPGCPDITVSPGQLNTGDSYSYDFAGQGFGATQTFTLKNEGTGTSEVLGFSLSGTGFAFSADTCSGGALPAGGTCTFRMTFTPGACQAPFLMDIGVTGGVPPTIEYLELILIASCST